MSAPIDPKTWATLVARAARRGIVLMRSEGAEVVIVAIDLQGKPHRIHTIDELESVLLEWPT